MRQMWFWIGAAAFVAIHGCAQRASFPTAPVQAGSAESVFDMNGDGRVDYWQRHNTEGQKTELRFDTDFDGKADVTVRPAELSAEECLHVVLVLDGVPFELVEQLYEEGHFRLFPRPSRVITVFPGMTDLALTCVFTDDTCLGYEASYYDRKHGTTSDGNSVYLSGANEPWVAMMDYRCNPLLDVQSYVNPRGLWEHELDGILRTIGEHETGTVRAYSVGTAGLGTKGGREAILDYLKTVDRICEQLTYERHGQIKFTLLADHGHDLTPGRRVSFRQALEKAGYRLTTRLTGPRDVVWIQYGLVTCSVLHTRDPIGVADVLVGHEGVDLVMYPEPANRTGPDVERTIIVRNTSGVATIHRSERGFRYRRLAGDPLRLQPVLEHLRGAGEVADDGTVADRDWLAATADHEYPDPLWRIWYAFNGLTQNPADVIVSMQEGHYCGSKFFSVMSGVASTHGTLSRRSSVTFALSNHAQLPPLLRVEDLGPYVRSNPTSP